MNSPIQSFAMVRPGPVARSRKFYAPHTVLNTASDTGQYVPVTPLGHAYPAARASVLPGRPLSPCRGEGGFPPKNREVIRGFLATRMSMHGTLVR